jgi:8-oxo-dGTP pyrophosphatase MutT (NUDIX family)
MNIHDEFTALAIIRNHSEVLVVERADWPIDRNLSFPGGKWDGKESPYETGERELYEETGLIVDIADLSLLGRRTHPTTGKQLLYFGAWTSACQGVLENKEPEKHHSVSFRSIDEVVEKMGQNNIFPPVLKFLS